MKYSKKRYNNPRNPGGKANLVSISSYELAIKIKKIRRISDPCEQLLQCYELIKASEYAVKLYEKVLNLDLIKNKSTIMTD